MTLTVTQLARECKLSRTTVLYYESIGLLRRPRRTDGNYRAYTAQDLDRLRQICAYRDAGLALADIRAVLDARPSDAAAVLRRRMLELNVEIERMRDHQRSIARLLKLGKDTEMVTKQKWTAIMSAAGFTEEDMRRWHREFEKSAPAEHQEFLEFLHIPSDEIQVIRTWSSQG
ncbi:MAG: transcriptional regulator, MerR family [Candidatus Solibacter sp.]|nr:transcriptional regulator, MerR family [Candidatus Solibacter sp.]